MKIQTSTIREAYFSDRLKSLSLANGRDLDGEREILTLSTVTLKRTGECNRELFDGKLVVDLGCGDQYLRSPLEERGARYFPLDICDCNFETDNLPIHDESTDFVISLAVIEHLFDPGKFLAEIRRILKPNGIVWLSTPNINYCKEKFWNDPTHVHPYNPTSLRHLLNINGFSGVSVVPNYRCKSAFFYQEHPLLFHYGRFLPFLGNSRLPVPEIFKGRCLGIFAFAQKGE